MENEGRHETNLIGAIETFLDDLSDRSLLYSNNIKGKSPGEEEGDQGISSNSSVGQSTEDELNIQTDC